MHRFEKVNNIAFGVELAEAVKSKFGQVLIAANVLIEEKHLRLLKTWGIESVCIKDELANANSIQIDEETKVKMTNELRNRYTWEPKNQFEENLLEMSLAAMIEKYFNNC